MRKRKPILIAAIVGISLLIVFACGFLFYQVSLQPVSSTSEKVEFEVVEGDSIGTVITRLEEQDMIKNATVSKLYAKINGLHNIKVGYFELDKAWNTKEMLSFLNDSANAKEDQVVITFREGIWAKDIAKAIEDKLQIPADDLIALWNDSTYLQTLIETYDFLDESILNEQVRVKLEGYLYPETYHFAKDATKEQITETFLDQFQVVYNEIKDDVAVSTMSMHDIITLASMVQFESKSVDDMYMISGVFHNRLAIDMSLESSVTICYALYDDYDDATDCEVNTTIASPYNTYAQPGLPIGPILNPGKDAILSTIHPKASDYIFFLADICGDGTVYYSTTYEQHNAYVAEYLTCY